MPSARHEDDAAGQREEKQCGADIEDYVGICEGIHLEGAGRYAAHVDGVGARLVAADGELYGGPAAAGDDDALVGLFLSVDVELDLGRAARCALVGYIGCYGNLCARCDFSSGERSALD